MPGLISALLILLIAFLLKKILDKKSALTYPPGPAGRFLIGNLREIPDRNPWLTYTEWAKRYGDVVHLQAVRDHIVVLSSVSAANDLLEKRSRVYSGRPHKDVWEFTGWDFNIAIQDYSDLWRENRRLYQQVFRPDAVVCLRPAIQQHIERFLKSILSSPGEFMSHIDTLSEGLAMKIMYGIDVKSGDDPLITLAKSVSNIGDRLVSPQYIAVIKYCPFLMSVPRWVPLLGPVRQLVEASNEYLQEFREQPMQRLKESGMGAEGIIPRLLQEAAIGNAKSEAYIRQVKDMATIVTLASADTTLSSTGTFFLAMANNARPQEIAQREIDMVVGKGHLPTPNDRPNLPYVEAIYQEVLRYRPPVPMGMYLLVFILKVLTTLSTGLPHMASQSDSYRGHYIPRGTIVMANIWAMTHDENVYPDPYEFKPERFLDKTVTINDILAYGFGRRVCVGRHLADTVLWWTFACVLACFDIRKETDEKGNEIDIPERYSPGPGVFSHPLPFRCRIIPRHAGVESLVSGTPPPE